MDKIKLSVVIPIYNVQEYLLDCVNSVINQNLNIEEYEILLLNDGSSDKSSDIAKALASEYKNIRYFFFENSGLGATRNKGIDLAKGTYITFLDSDDIVPQIAYETLLTTAMKNNSDVVTAPVERFENNKFLRSGLHKRVKFDPAEKVTLKEYKELVYDTTSTNKIYKLSFLKNNNLYFPVNILYEDIYFSLRVFALSTNISVVDQVSYIWRIRSGENVSITQNRLNIQGYKDRLNTVLKTLNFLREHCEEVVANEFEKKIIDFDIPLFFPDYKNGDLEYTKDFVLETINILKALKVSYIEECDYRKQAIYYAIFKHDYETVLNYSLDNIKEFKMEVRNGEVQLTDKFLSNEIINKINPLNIVDIYSEFSEVVYNKKEVIINCKVKSSVMKDINKTSNENISAFLYSANDLIEVKLNRVDKEDYQIIIPLELIPYTSSFNRLKVKLVYTINDNVYSETLLSDPKNKKLKTTLMKPLRGYNLNIQNNFNWELFIEKKKTETIFKEITIERDNLIVKTNMIDEDAIYLLDNNKDKPLEGKVVNQRLIFNLNKLKQEKVMELKVLKSGAKTYNFQFDKKPSFFTVFNTLNYNEYVLRVYNNHSFSISKKGKHSTLKNIIFDNKKINIIFEAPYNFNNISKVRLLLNSINGKVSKEISARHIGENNYIASIDLTHATQNTFFPYGEYKIYIDYYNNQKLLPQSQLLN
ncbi:glycosyltransferase family 2 protein, partial [Staphylococcus felis]